MHWIQGNRRGRLTGDKSNMLVFLFHNARFLQHIENDSTSIEDSLPKSWHTLTEEEQEVIDEEYFNDWMGGMPTTVPTTTTITSTMSSSYDSTQGQRTAEMVAMARDVLNFTQESVVEL